MAQDFETWFAKRFPEETFPEHCGALQNAFKEIAHDAWVAGAEFHLNELKKNLNT